MISRFRRTAAVVIALAVLWSEDSVRAAAPPDTSRNPILIELFTSEGCSSCPPADEWVKRLDEVQPVNGAQLIVLSEHVDYWDHDGWKDPYSSSALTARQQDYAHSLGITDVYTPQIILDGYQELHPQNRQQVVDILTKSAGAAMLPVTISAPALAPGEPVFLTGNIVADGTGQKRAGDVYVAIALDRTETDVLAGENNGKKLTNVAVVKDLVKIGKLEKGKSFDQPFRVRLWPGAERTNLRVVAFVQEPGAGKVLGAAMTKQIGQANGVSAFAAPLLRQDLHSGP